MTATVHARPPSLGEMFRLFLRIGCLSFGGPAGQVALMHREIVEQRGWVEEGAFLRALNLCHLLPGPEAQQLATWIGWRLHGTLGGLIAGLLFILPGALVMVGLSLVYALAMHMAPVAAIFLGIKAAVLAVVVQALLRIAGRALKGTVSRLLALGAFLALFLFKAPFPLVVIGALLLGMMLSRIRPDWLAVHAAPADQPRPPAPRLSRVLLTIAGWLLVWGAPLAAIWLTLGPDHVLWHIGIFFSKLAVVTFGGAYAVLAYMAQQAVDMMGWLDARQMADGLGLAETTPGPLILVTQFVGFLGAWHDPAPFSPLVAGLLGAALTSWVTFAPCFLWIFTFAPWMERLERATALQGGLAAVTATVVGVIANLSLWFALHVLFARVAEVGYGPLHLSLPDVGTVDWRAAVITLAAALLLFRFRVGMLPTLAICAGAGLVLGQFGGAI